MFALARMLAPDDLTKNRSLQVTTSEREKSTHVSILSAPAFNISTQASRLHRPALSFHLHPFPLPQQHSSTKRPPSSPRPLETSTRLDECWTRLCGERTGCVLQLRYGEKGGLDDDFDSDGPLRMGSGSYSFEVEVNLGVGVGADRRRLMGKTTSISSVPLVITYFRCCSVGVPLQRDS